MARTLPIVTAALIVALIVLAPAQADDNASKNDLAAMQGQWQMASGERGGEAMPEEMVKTGKRTLKDDHLTVSVGEMLIMKATITLDATKNPKTIDYVVTDGPNKGKTQLGIYELTGNTLKSCFAAPDQDRPTTFSTKPGDGWTSSVWKKS